MSSAHPVLSFSLDRRHFLNRTGLAMVAGWAASGSSLLAAAARPASRVVDLALPAQDKRVLAWLRTFALDARLAGATVLARLGGDTAAASQWIASVADLSALPEVFARAGSGSLYTEGNAVYFTFGGCDVSVEFLPPAAFATRLRELANGQVAFEHETLVFNPATGQLSDPLGAARGRRALRTARRGRDLVGAFEQVLTGLIASQRLGLAPTAAFKRYRALVLGASGARLHLAEGVLARLCAHFVVWVQQAPVGEIETVLTSRLILTSVRACFGIDAQASIQTFVAGLGGDAAPNPAAWLAALFSEPVPAEVATWLRSGDRFEQMRTRAAFAS